MIDQLSKNNQDIEMYYQMGSSHGNIRIMLNRYIYDELCIREILNNYSMRYGLINNVNINLVNKTISMDIKKDTLNFQDEFASAMYEVIFNNYLDKLYECLDMFELGNSKYRIIKENLKLLKEPSYYISLFRTTFIKHKDSTSCILQF